MAKMNVINKLKEERKLKEEPLKKGSRVAGESPHAQKHTAWLIGIVVFVVLMIASIGYVLMTSDGPIAGQAVRGGGVRDTSIVLSECAGGEGWVKDGKYILNTDLVLTKSNTDGLKQNYGVDGAYCFKMDKQGVEIDCQGHSIKGDGTEKVDGVFLLFADDTIVKNCVISNLNKGITLGYAKNALVSENLIFDVDQGIYVTGHSVQVGQETTTYGGDATGTEIISNFVDEAKWYAIEIAATGVYLNNNVVTRSGKGLTISHGNAELYNTYGCKNTNDLFVHDGFSITVNNNGNYFDSVFGGGVPYETNKQIVKKDPYIYFTKDQDFFSCDSFSYDKALDLTKTWTNKKCTQENTFLTVFPYTTHICENSKWTLLKDAETIDPATIWNFFGSNGETGSACQENNDCDSSFCGSRNFNYPESEKMCFGVTGGGCAQNVDGVGQSLKSMQISGSGGDDTYVCAIPKLILFPLPTEKSQLFVVDPQSKKRYCVGAEKGDVTLNSKAVLQECQLNKDQFFVGDEKIIHSAENQDLCLIRGKNEENVIFGKCNKISKYWFNIKNDPSNTEKDKGSFLKYQGNLCLSVSKFESGGAVSLKDCTESESDLWFFESPKCSELKHLTSVFEDKLCTLDGKNFKWEKCSASEAFVDSSFESYYCFENAWHICNEKKPQGNYGVVEKDGVKLGSYICSFANEKWVTSITTGSSCTGEEGTGSFQPVIVEGKSKSKLILYCDANTKTWAECKSENKDTFSSDQKSYCDGEKWSLCLPQKENQEVTSKGLTYTCTNLKWIYSPKVGDSCVKDSIKFTQDKKSLWCTDVGNGELELRLAGGQGCVKSEDCQPNYVCELGSTNKLFCQPSSKKNSDGCIDGWSYKHKDETITGPYSGCTDVDENGKPWCSMNKIVYVSGGIENTDWKYCSLADQMGCNNNKIKLSSDQKFYCDKSNKWQECKSGVTLSSDGKYTCDETTWSIKVDAPVVLGDVDGNGITISDVLIVVDHILGTKTLTGDDFKVADVTCDKTINIQDVIGIVDAILSNKNSLSCPPKT